MRKSKYILISNLILATGVLLSACSSSNKAENKNQTLNWMTNAEIQTMDPSKMIDTTSSEQAINTFEGLNRLGKDGKIEPGIATKSIQSKDGLTWTFQLRKNAKWSNGDPVTAKDFIYSLRRTLDPKTASQQQMEWGNIVNANDIVLGKKKPSYLGVEAKGNYKLVVHLTAPVPYFKSLTASGWQPQNEKVVKKWGKKYGTSSKYMVYDGPFVQKGWTGSNLSWKLEKNKNYWDKDHVKLNHINFSVIKTPSTDYNLYQANKLDGALLDTQGSKELKNQKGYHVFKLDRTEYLDFNIPKSKLFANINFRRAISLAIDRAELAKTTDAGNVPAINYAGPNETINGQNFVNFVAKHSDNEFSRHNRVLAKQLFNRALKQTGLEKATFTLLGDDDDNSKKVTEFVQSNLKDCFGDKISVSVQNLPKMSRIKRLKSGNYEACFSGMSSDYLDPNSMLSQLTSNASYNDAHWKNKKFDQLIAESQKEKNLNKRLQVLTKAQEILNNEQGVIPLFYDGQAWMVRPDVKQLVFTGTYFDFKNTEIK